MRITTTLGLAAACSLSLTAIGAGAAAGDSGQTNDPDETMTAREVIDRSFTLNPGAEVSVEGVAGPVTVETGNGSRAEVHIVRMGRTEQDLACYQVRVDGSAARLEIQHVQDRSRACRNIRAGRKCGWCCRARSA